MTMPRKPGSPDSSTEERLVTGQMDPADAPPGFRAVAGLLQEAGTVPPAEPAAGDEPVIQAMVAAITSSAAAETPAGSPRRRRSRRLAKVLAAATFATVASGGVAAASGSLPDPLQDAVSNAAGIVGVEIPRGKAYGHLDKVDKDAVKEADKADRGGATGPGGPQGSADHGRGSEVSGTAQDPALEGAEKGACVSDVASSGKSRAGEEEDISCPSGGESDPSAVPSEDGLPTAPAPKGAQPEELPAGPGHGQQMSGDRGHRSAEDDPPAPAQNGQTPKRGRS